MYNFFYLDERVKISSDKDQQWIMNYSEGNFEFNPSLFDRIKYQSGTNVEISTNCPHIIFFSFLDVYRLNPHNAHARIHTLNVLSCVVHNIFLDVNALWPIKKLLLSILFIYCLCSLGNLLHATLLERRNWRGRLLLVFSKITDSVVLWLSLEVIL